MSLPRTITSRARTVAAGVAIAAIAAGSEYAIAKHDPGAEYYQSLRTESQALFGMGRPLDHEATGSMAVVGAGAVEAAKGLKVSLVSSNVGEDADMIALWPNDRNPTWAIICNEITGNTPGSPATVQRVRLSTGAVEDMVFGHVSCDPAH